LNIDSEILQWFQRNHNRTLDAIMVDVTYLGSYTILAILGLFVVSFLVLQKEYQKAAVAVAFFFVSSSSVELLKGIVGRPRPVIEVQLTRMPSDKSFPSDHSILTMSIYLICAQVMRIGHRRFLIGFAIATSIIVGFSKMYIGLNYFTDVIIAWILGGAFGFGFYFINDYLERQHPIMRRQTDLPLPPNGR
jgi:undecaprenyl-diphosphatase